MKDGAVWISSKDDVAKLLWLDQASLRAHGVGELLTVRNRLATNLSRRIHIVLSLNRCDNLRRGHAKLRKLVGLNPDAKRILASEYLRSEERRVGKECRSRWA